MARTRKSEKIKESATILPDVIIDTRKEPRKKKKQIHKTVKTTNNTAHRILDVAVNTHEIADSANDKVHEQGEQIDNIAGIVADTQLTIKESKAKVKGINSIFHAVKNFFTPRCLQAQKEEIHDSVKNEIQTQRDKKTKLNGKTHWSSHSKYPHRVC